MTTPMMWYPAFFSMLILLTSICPCMGQETKDRLLLALKIEPPVLLCGETVPINHPQVSEPFEKEMLLSLGNRPQVILWLKRTTRYFPYIEQVLKEQGLPDDTKYLAIAESALRLHAGSRKGAMGVWQLMPQTARKYGLTVNGRFDERRNIFLSTPAAVAYLKDLHNRFGTWTLALAAYNMGEEGLEAEILEQGITDYYRLYLPLETQRFIFRILAIKQIVDTPEKFGFTLSPNDFYSPVAASVIQVNAFNDLPLRLIAKAAGVDFKAIKEYNPEIRGHYLASGTRAIRIPGGGEAGFHERLASLVEEDAHIRSRRIYVVKKGDNLSGIAKKFDVPLAAMLIWNRIGINGVIHPGQRLVIFPGTNQKETILKEIDGDADG